MISTYSQLSCAANSIPAVHEYLANAKFHLYTASTLGEKYYQTWHSIIWIRSNTATKKRVSEQLNNLAFDCYSHFLEATDYLNQYAELMNQLRINQPLWYAQLYVDLQRVYDSFHEEHAHEIYWRQLNLYACC